MNNSEPSATLMTETLTYFRKKKLGRRKCGSSSACLHLEISGLPQQAGHVSEGQLMLGSMPEITESKISHVDSQTSVECNTECLPNSMSLQESNISRLLGTTCTVTRKKARRLMKLSDIEDKVSLPVCNAETKDNCSDRHDDSKDVVMEVFTKEVKRKMKGLASLVPNKTEKAVDNNKSGLNSQQVAEGNDVSHCKYIHLTSYIKPFLHADNY